MSAYRSNRGDRSTTGGNAGGPGGVNSGRDRRRNANDRESQGTKPDYRGGGNTRSDGPRGPDNRGPSGGSNRQRINLPAEGGRNSGRSAQPVSSMHDRLLFVFQNLVGYNVSVQLKDGTVYEGIFHTAHVERQEVSIVLQMAILIHEGGGGLPEPNKPRPRVVPTKSVVLQAKDFVQVTAKDVTLFNQVGGSSSAGSDLVTDSSLGSRQKGAGKVGRELVAWQPDEDDGAVALEDSLVSMPPPGRGAGRNEAWDQFRANSESFGVQSTFDENLYTTRLDVGEGGISEQEAERIAREIEQSSTSNPHVAEERGQVVGLDENMDEEDRFSSVVRADASKETFDSRNEATFGDEDTSEPPKHAWSSGPPSMISQERAASVASGSRGSAESQEAQSREHVRLRLHMGAGAQTKGKPAAGQPSFLPSSKWAPVGGVQVGNADQLQALNLDTARVEVPEEVYRDFHAFKDKQYQESAGGARQPARVEQTQRMRAFSQEMQLREGVATSAGQPSQPPASGEPKQEYDVKWVGKTPADTISPTASGASAAQKPAAVPAPVSPTSKPISQPPTSAAPPSTSEAPKEAKKSTFTFNVNAKPFTLNVNAKEFTPNFTPGAPAVPRPAAAPAQPPPVTHVPFVMQPAMPPQPHMYGGVPGQPMMQYAVAQTAYIPGHAYQVPGQHGQPRPPYRHGQQQVVSQYPPAVHVAQPPQYPPGTVLVGTPPLGPGMHPAAARPQAHMHAAPPPGTPVVTAPPMPSPPVEDVEKAQQPPPPSI